MIKHPSHQTVAALLLVLSVLAYGNGLTNDFVFDDLPLIAHNRAIADLTQLPGLFFRDYWAGSQDVHEAAVSPRSGLYRPLVIATYVLNAAIGGLHPIGFHAINLVLHALVSWLLYLVAVQRGMNSIPALAASVTFAIHPIHTEAVTAIIGRAEVMMSVGALAYLWFAGKGKVWLSCLALAVALFSKEQAIVLPFVLLLNECPWAKERPAHHSTRSANQSWIRSVWPRYAAYALVLSLYLALRWIALGGFTPPPADSLVNPAATAGTGTRVWTATKVAGIYLWLMIWPASLSANYSFDSIPLAHSPLDPAVATSALVWASCLALGGWAFARDARLMLLSVSLLVLPFLPVSNLLVPIGTIMGERLFYLPSAGLCLLAGLAFERLLTRLRLRFRLREGSSLNLSLNLIAQAMFVLLCLALIVRTGIRNRDWKDNEHIALSMLRVVPNNAMAHALLGYTLKVKATPEAQSQALQEYETALRIYPEYVRLDPVFASHYGQLQFLAGRPMEAVRVFQEALTTHPRWSTVHYNLGLAYAKVGRIAEAERELREAQALNPTDADTYNVLSHVLLQQRRFAEGLAAAEGALKIAPQHEGARYYRDLAKASLATQPMPDHRTGP